MTTEVIVFICLLILNTLISLVYLIVSLITKNKNCVIKTFVMLICPVIGPLFFLAAYLWYRLFFSEPVDLEDVVFSKERVTTYMHAEEEIERNMVSLEEAIEITNEKDLRSLMMNIVRGDIKKFLATISLALDSEDTEVAHYAASVLQDALNDFRMNVEKQRKHILADVKNNVDEANVLMDYMNQVLVQKVFTDMEQRNYVYVFDEISELYFSYASNPMTSAQLEAVSMRLLEISDYAYCKKWCERAKVHYPNTLSTYTCQLKLYFSSGEKQSFFQVVEELKHSSVVIDNETLELLRVFN